MYCEKKGYGFLLIFTETANGCNDSAEKSTIDFLEWKIDLSTVAISRNSEDIPRVAKRERSFIL